MAQFSKSLFNAIQGYGDPINPAAGQGESKYIPMGTSDRLARKAGDFMQSIGLNTDYMKTGQERAGAAGQEAAAAAGGMSKKEGLAMAMLAQAKFLKDPVAQQAQVMKAQELLAAAAEEKASKAASMLNMQRLEQEQKTLMKIARDFGDDAAAEQVAQGWMTMDDAGKNALRKHLRELKVADLSKTDKLGARMVRLAQAGIKIGPDGVLTKEQARNMSKEQADALISSTHADIKFFTGPAGNQVVARVNKESGLVENPNFVAGVEGAKQWVNASSLELTQPPNRSEVVQKLDNQGKVSEMLIDMGIESYEELNVLAKKGESTIYQGEEALALVEEMYTGMGAGVKLEAGRLGRLLAGMLGVPYDPTSEVSTEQYAIMRLYDMAIFIKALGSGTGLSDKDAELALKAVAGDKTLQKETIQLVINQFIKVARFAIAQRDEATEILSRGVTTDQDMLDLITLRNAPTSNRSTDDGEPPALTDETRRWMEENGMIPTT